MKIIQHKLKNPVQNINFLDKQGDEEFLGLINQLKIQFILYKY